MDKESLDLLLDQYADAVRRRFQANQNFSRCTDSEIADRLAEEKAARKRILDFAAAADAEIERLWQ